jgi:GWxTD domain-containing protein
MCAHNNGFAFDLRKAAYVVAVGAFCSGAWAAESDFYFDYGAFYAQANGKVSLSVFYAVPLNGLTPTKTEEGAVLYRFNVGARLERKTDAAVVANVIDTRTDVITATDEYKTPLSIGELKLNAPPGEYNLNIGIGDLAAGEPSVVTVGVVIPEAPATGPYLSDIEIANAVGTADADENAEFVKSGWNVLPNPTKIVSDRGGSMAIYFEVYRIPEGASYILQFEIVQTNGRRYFASERPLERIQGDVARVETLDIAGIPPGPYLLNLKLLDGERQQLYGTSKGFAIYHEYGADEIAALRGKFMPFSLEEEKQVRREMALVATPAEVATYDALPAEEKPIFVDSFWARRDPDKNTPENEFKNAFYVRYRYAQEHFSTPFREGIDTDRGRVYLKYGEPDNIKHSPMGSESESGFEGSTWQSDAFEGWEYNKTGGIDNQYILFVFIDSNGDGNYELDSSTVPGYGRLIRPDNANGQ